MKSILFFVFLLPLITVGQSRHYGSHKFEDTVRVPTVATSDSSQKAASTAWVKQQGFGGGGGGGTITGTNTHVTFFDGSNNPAGDAGMTYNKTKNALQLAGSAADITSWLDVNSTQIANAGSTPPGITWFNGGAGSFYGAFLGYHSAYGTEFTTSNSGSFFWSDGGGNSVSDWNPRMTLNSSDQLLVNGAIKIGALTAPSEVLDVAGNIRFSGALKPNNDAGTSGYILESQAGSVNSWKVYVESTFTPTLTNTTNIAASTAYTTHYNQIGNKIEFWGDASVDATAALTITEMGMSLPVTSALANTYDLSGVATFEDGTSVQIKADVTNGRAVWRWTPLTATNNRYSFRITYKYTAP